MIGTGIDGALPVMKEDHQQAHCRKVELVIVPTAHAISELGKTAKDTNAILHLTC